LNKYDNYALSISATTRNPREGEVHGREYFFLSTEQFEEMIKADQFIEYAQYVKNYYGTPRSYVEEKMAEGKDVILEIEIQGALKVKEKFPETLLVFVVPPTAEDLKNRLVGRGTETKEVIEERMKRALEESEEMDSYDYILVNDTVEKAVEDLHNLIQSQHLLARCNAERIVKMKEELKKIVE